LAYIGTIPAEAYTSFAVQHFTTSATTSYTLDNAVANENEIALFVNNVRQEPGSGYAYTASGTALTLSAATSASDTMYCVFIGKAVQTVTPASNSVTGAMIVDGTITSSEINDGTITDAKINSSTAFDFPVSAYFGEETLTDGATIDWNLQTQQVSKVTLAGNRTLNAPTNQNAGGFYSLLIVQDGTGSRTLSFNSAYKFTGATAPTLTTTASAKDLIVFRSDGTNLLEVGRSLNIG
jgi:hypothetical protein